MWRSVYFRERVHPEGGELRRRDVCDRGDPGVRRPSANQHAAPLLYQGNGTGTSYDATHVPLKLTTDILG